MPTAEDYRRRVRALDATRLRVLWSAIKAGDTPGWAPGKAFEYFLLRIFELEGAKVRWPYQVRVHDELVEQIDGVIYHGGLSVIVESKDEQEPVNVEPLAKLRSQLLRRPAGTIGLVVTTNGFTSPARILADFMAPTTVLLWEGAEIDVALETTGAQPFCRGLQWKYRLAVEEGAAFSDLTALWSP